MSETITTKPGDVAWFVCRRDKLVDDIFLPLQPGVATTEAEVAKKGRMRAARYFKRWHELHPCTRVDCELQAIGPSAAFASDSGQEGR
jgi:hypothetical protein